MEQYPSSFNTTSAFIDTNTTVGNITINNTADINLTFNISKTSSTVPSIYFNNTGGSYVFNLTPGSSTIIEVIATGQSIESEQEVGIIIDPSQSSASPDYLFTNFTLISYVSGPYLDVDISEYDSTVTQGQTRVTLTGSIINVGNETANNVSAYWTLPSEWTPKTNVTSNYTTLSVGQQVSFTRHVDIDSDATTGTQTIRIDVNCSEGKHDSDQRSVSVNSSGGETPVTTTGGGGGGGGMLISKITKLDIDIVNETEIERGTNHTYKGVLNNIGETDLENITLALEGFPLVHYKIKPEFLDKLEANTSKPFSLFINIPEYFGGGKHEISLEVKTLADNEWKKFSKGIILIVLTEDKARAVECFENARTRINEMQNIGLSTAKLNRKLGEAKKGYNNKNYVDANTLCKETVKEADLAMKINDKINSIKSVYSSLEQEIPELNELISLMQDAFEREEYELASRRVEQAELLLGLKEKEVQQTWSYKWDILRKYLKEIIIAMVFLTIIGIFAHSSTSIKAITKKIKALEKRRDVVNNKIKEVQHKYFVKKVIPARLYKKEMEHHRNSLADIEKKKHMSKLKKLKIISGRRLKDLEKARQEAHVSKKELQRKYFVEKSIDKKTFKKLILGFEKISQDIEKKIELKNKKKE